MLTPNFKIEVLKYTNKILSVNCIMKGEKPKAKHGIIILVDIF
ncbi:hypothetical protein [uncultured Brachyspira sp.]|nr:hypothetical protein [uncultured Brachyspira sp.]